MQSSLKKRYEDVSYFQKETDCLEALDQKPNVLILNDSQQFSRPVSFIRKVKEYNGVNVIFVSKNTHLFNMLKVIKGGAADFVRKDSCTNYAVNKSIERLMKLTDNFSEHVSSKEFFQTSSFQMSNPLYFRLSRFMLF